ncbi:hypothetical protein COLO4_33925 [Corchorus olitorius]|uniref:Uncharacterized protein n=1 Tax=Corchorus olitorius TaxID=93759 RepID=A0A1R3GPW6_9ROSI|nr:hypothetical protein COLO4_33925 [Corchorus olitorius]
MALPLTRATQNRVPSSEAFFKPLPVKPSRAVTTTRPNARLQVKANLNSNLPSKKKKASNQGFFVQGEGDRWFDCRRSDNFNGSGANKINLIEFKRDRSGECFNVKWNQIK